VYQNSDTRPLSGQHPQRTARESDTVEPFLSRQILVPSQREVALRHNRRTDAVHPGGVLSNLLAHHPRIEPNSGYVRFLQFGASSLDLEVFAYVMARDWSHFLEIQGELLLRSMEAVDATGAQIALQSPIFVAPTSAPQSKQVKSIEPNEPQQNRAYP
jgi:hypothetical protein